MLPSEPYGRSDPVWEYHRIFSGGNLKLPEYISESGKESITIDFGDIKLKGRYCFKIIKKLGLVRWNHAVEIMYYTVNTNSLGGPGTYYLLVADEDHRVQALMTLVFRLVS